MEPQLKHALSCDMCAQKRLCKVGDELEVHIVGTKSYTDPIKVGRIAGWSYVLCTCLLRSDLHQQPLHWVSQTLNQAASYPFCSLPIASLLFCLVTFDAVFSLGVWNICSKIVVISQSTLWSHRHFHQKLQLDLFLPMLPRCYHIIRSWHLEPKALVCHVMERGPCTRKAMTLLALLPNGVSHKLVYQLLLLGLLANAKNTRKSESSKLSNGAVCLQCLHMLLNTSTRHFLGVRCTGLIDCTN